MRLPENDEDLVGKVCVTGTGRAFIVTGTHTFDWGKAWVGLGFDNRGTVASKDPCIIAENGQDFHDDLLKKFNGKLSYNS